MLATTETFSGLSSEYVIDRLTSSKHVPSAVIVEFYDGLKIPVYAGKNMNWAVGSSGPERVDWQVKFFGASPIGVLNVFSFLK